MPLVSRVRDRNAGPGSYRAAWALLIAAAVCGTAGLVINAAAGNPSKLSKGAVLEIGGLVLVLWAIAVVLLLFAVSRFNRARRAAEQQHEESMERRLAAEHATRAGRLAGQLMSGETPAVGHVWEVVLAPGEQVLWDGTAGYSRYYALGSPSAHAQVSAGQYRSVGSGQRPRAQGVALAAAARWRDQQQSRVVITDRRLLCKVKAKGWLSFEHGKVTTLQAVRRGVVLEYPNIAPLCLSGPVSAEITVTLVWALYGADGLREHPALAEVRSVAVFPDATASAASELPDSEAPMAVASASSDASAKQPRADPVQPAERPSVDLLEFVAAHELVLAAHAALLLGVSAQYATERLERLTEQGMVSRVRLRLQSPTAYQITPRGAGQIDGASPPPGPIALTGVGHALAVPGVWLAARSGRFGEARDVLSARQMRAADASSRSESLLAVPGARFSSGPRDGDAGTPRRYPDLGLLWPAGGWTSVQLLLTTPDPAELDTLLERLTREKVITEQWFFTTSQQTGELISQAAAALGVGGRVQMKHLDPHGATVG